MEEHYRILVIDDDEIDRMAVRRALRAADPTTEVAEATEGATAVRMLSAERFDCALLDYLLGDRDGLQVLREVRAAGVRTPIVMVTGQGSEQVAVDIMKAGASDYLVKTRISLEHLWQTIRNVIRVHRAESQTEQALARVRESEQRFRTMADSAPVLLWVADADGLCTYFNQGWLDFTGRSHAQECGEGWAEGIHPDDRRGTLEAYESHFDARTAFETEYRLRRRDGEYRWIFDRGTPRFLPDGTFAGYIGSCIDITERKRDEEQRAMLLEREQAARAEAESARWRLEFLAEASKVLGASLDYEVTLSSVARLSVPRVADWCAIDVVADEVAAAPAAPHPNDPGPAGDNAGAPEAPPVRRVAVAHTDPAKAQLGETAQDRRGAQSSPTGIYQVLRTGRSELYSEVTEDLLREIAQGPEHLGILRGLAARSIMIVPLVARGRTLGTITLVAAESDRRYGPADLALAEDLARRAGAAIDNARLYRQAQHAFRQKDEAAALLDTLFASAPIGVCFLDTDLRFQKVNESLAAVNGIPAEQHIGRALCDVAPMLWEAVRPHVEHVLATGQPVLNVEVSSPGGEAAAESGAAANDDAAEPRYWLTSWYPVRSRTGSVLGIGVVLNEITERKRHERELKAAKDAAEAANNAKDQFLAVLSHELRTPLTPVLTTIQMLQSEKHLPADMRSCVEMIRRNVELEARLIDDLLDLTRISKGKLQLNLAAIDAHESLRSVIAICEADARAKQLEVSLELTARCHHVRADSARLQQVFWNLVKNAVKFTPAGGKVTVRTENTQDGPGLRASVTDTGIGIEPDAIGRIFDAFEQAEQSITRRFGGLGLGLAISKALVDMHGGRLTAASEGKGRGSTFSVELASVRPELWHEPDGSGSPAGEAPASGAKPRILLVDDHQDTANAMQRLLQRMGYRVQTANSVASAVETCGRDRFDLLISDIGLPDGSGLDLMRRLNPGCAANGSHLKGIALSGFGMEDDVRKSKEAGFAEHLTKPVNFQRLEAVIRELTSA